MPAQAIQRAPQPAAVRREPLVCPNCGQIYQVDPRSIGRSGRKVRCPACEAHWFDVSAVRADYEIGVNPILGVSFPDKLKRYLNGLPDGVKQDSGKSTHAIKSFLIRHGLADGAIGHANGIKVNLPQHRNSEFMWDVVSKVESRTHPGEDHDLLFVAESENQAIIGKILEDATKLPIVRADARLMFFRAPNAKQLELYFDRLHGLFKQHRKTAMGDVYMLAGMDMQTGTYRVRKLTIRREMANVSPWEEF